jgi:hypothetical protein
MEALRIVLYSVFAAVVYGVVHDQITARICLEYFTVFHPPVLVSDSPTLQGLIWGVIATWWVGASLGIPLAMAARLGSWPKCPSQQMIRPLATLMVYSASVAIVAGLIGFTLATNGLIWVAPRWADRIPSQRHIGFLVDGWAHTASYVAAFVGGWVLIFATIFRRARDARLLRKPAALQTRLPSGP